MGEIIKIAKTSSHLNGTYQKALKTVTFTTMSYIEVLRSKADRTVKQANSEIKALCKELRV